MTEQAVIATSPFNGYYTVETMAKLFAWAQAEFGEFKIFVMDGASVYNLMAFGYSESKAKSKTKKQDRGLENKIARSLALLGISAEILRLSDLQQTDIYKQYYSQYLALYAQEPFKSDCREATAAMLRQKNITADAPAIDCAVNYLLAELPIWCNLPQILDAKTTLVYKDLLPFWQRVCEKYNLVSSDQKIVIRK